MLDEIQSKTMHKGEEDDQQWKKNLLSFLEIHPLQKDRLPSHKLLDHAYES